MKVVDLNEWMQPSNYEDDNIDDDVFDDWLFIETTTDFEVIDPITCQEYYFYAIVQ